MDKKTKQQIAASLLAAASVLRGETTGRDRNRNRLKVGDRVYLVGRSPGEGDRNRLKRPMKVIKFDVDDDNGEALIVTKEGAWYEDQIGIIRDDDSEGGEPGDPYEGDY